jgi:transcription elongation factor Elf1
MTTGTKLCPYCNNKILVEISVEKQSVKCNVCNKTFEFTNRVIQNINAATNNGVDEITKIENDIFISQHNKISY